jgi:hypothetical protein
MKSNVLLAVVVALLVGVGIGYWIAMPKGPLPNGVIPPAPSGVNPPQRDQGTTLIQPDQAVTPSK